MRFIAWLVLALRFGAFYVFEVVRSNFKVARDVLHPRPVFRPGLVAVAVDHLTDRQRLVLAILLTMTPGTISVELNGDPARLLLHTLYVPEDPERLRASIRNDYESAIARLF
ncbi:MAG: Na+/H+ antiporter subunit E [Opitutaceae bacterium]|nr:Na+/H+ antiporter subunit E [Opitutaceae bacterium]